MLFLADESCDFAVVRALRKAGHDVLAVAEQSAQASDENVLDLARREGRIVLTEDKDFGRLIFAYQGRPGSVVLIRFPASYRSSLPEQVVQLVTARGDALRGRFVVVQPGRVRISGLPSHFA